MILFRKYFITGIEANTFLYSNNDKLMLDIFFKMSSFPLRDIKNMTKNGRIIVSDKSISTKYKKIFFIDNFIILYNSIAVKNYFYRFYKIMRYSNHLDKFLNSSSLSASIFLASGVYKTHKDYKNASPKYKKRFLIKDTVVLAGAAAGLITNHAIGNKIVKNKIYEKFVSDISNKINGMKFGTTINYTKSIVKELIAGFTSTALGVLGALGADYLLSKTNFKQPKYSKVENNQDKLNVYLENNLVKYADKDTVDVLYSSVTGMPKMKFFSSGLVGMDAIDLAKDIEFDKRLDHTTKYLLNDTLLPLLFLSTSSALTKNMKAIYRIPIIFSSLVGGTLILNKLLEKQIANEDKK